MSRGHKSQDVAEFVVKGIENAFHSFHKMSHGEWLNAAPEHFVAGEITRTLQSSLRLKGIFPEYSVDEALKEAGSTRRGKPRAGLRRAGRYDILLTRQNFDPWCVIEVKSPVWNAPQIKSDLKRIKDTLIHRKNGSTLRCGISAFYCDAAKPKRNAEKTAQDVLVGLAKRAASIAKSLCKPSEGFSVRLVHGKPHAGKQSDAWMACCIFVEIKKSRDS